MTYLLSDCGMAITWGTWKSIGGCGLSGVSFAAVSRKLGPIAHWDPATLKLGEIQDACVVAGRELARFAKDHLEMADFWIQERR